MRVRRGVPITNNAFGFRLGRHTTKIIPFLRRRVETYRERKKDLHMVFIVLEKNYDKFPRDVL